MGVKRSVSIKQNDPCEEILWCSTLSDESAELDRHWTWWWLWRLRWLWLRCSLSSCYGSINLKLTMALHQTKEEQKVDDGQTCWNTCGWTNIVRNLTKTKLSDKVASCSFAAPLSLYFATEGVCRQCCWLLCHRKCPAYLWVRKGQGVPKQSQHQFRNL